ncbi:hypothetical protein LCGC14_2267110 [marine sediment metagenome]|uniref:Uncharacterized protein n=1 Tax=marine sediment metagenome TaxID=412755 RepID=A0A0F9FAE9_9ZZZZ
MERSKGKLKADGWNGRAGICIWDKNLNHIFTVERLSMMKLADQQDCAEELLCRWNAFEEGGLAGEMRDVIRELLGWFDPLDTDERFLEERQILEIQANAILAKAAEVGG